jgi:2-deoxy-D-gluconate 3-dehydrogenase
MAQASSAGATPAAAARETPEVVQRRVEELFLLRGRAVIVTGAGRGIGRAIAVALADAGAVVVGIARSPDELRSTQEFVTGRGRPTFHPVVFDLHQTERLSELVESVETQFGEVFGVVHAAGVQLRKPAVDVTPDEWNAVHKVNLEAPFFLSTALAKRQIASQRRGSHVFVGSLTSAIGAAGVAPYCATKSAVAGVVRALAVEWAADGIRVNGIGPGYFQTALTEEPLSSLGDRQRILGRIPMGRIGDPEDLAGAVLFLLGDASSYMTGQFVYVDGGWLAG